MDAEVNVLPAFPLKMVHFDFLKIVNDGHRSLWYSGSGWTLYALVAVLFLCFGTIRTKSFNHILLSHGNIMLTTWPKSRARHLERRPNSSIPFTVDVPEGTADAE